MKILMIGTRLTTGGGMQQYIRNLLLHLDLERFQVDLLATPAGDGPGMETLLRQAGVNILYMPGEDKQRLLFYPGFFKNHHDYDIIHFHTTSKVNALACLYIRRACPRAVLIAHAHTVYPPVTLTWRAAHLLYRRSVQRFLACGKAAGSFVFGPGVPQLPNFSVACNAVDRRVFFPDPAARAAARAAWNIPDGARLAGFVGRYNHGKNILFVLEILAELLKRDPEFRLILVGGGEEQPAVDAAIRRLGLEERVIQAGVRSDVAAFMNAFDVFLLPSKFEGSPVTLVEAQGCGLTCFASDHVPDDCAVTDLVHFLPLDAPASRWAEAIDRTVRCAEHPDRWDALAAAGYDLDAAARRMEEVYTDALTLKKGV